jgi:hypothetical protein
MKSLLLSTIFLFAGTALFSQTIPVGPSKVINYNSTSVSAERNGIPNQTFSTVDTADEYIVRATGAQIVPVTDGGYAFGTSYYYDVNTATLYFVTDECGLEFDAVGSATITDLIFWSARKYINGAPDNLNAKVYDAGPDSMPSNLLGSESMSMQDVDTSSSSPVFTQITFSTPPGITGNYFVSMEYAGFDDTICFVSTGPGNGMMERRLRHKASADFGGQWKRMGELFNFMDVDMFWAPIYTILDDGINHFTLKNKATVQPLYPTVSSTQLHLDYSLPSSSEVGYYIFDLKGNRYFEVKSEQQLAGTYSQSFDVTTLAAGNYFVAITINGQMITQKAVVAK